MASNYGWRKKGRHHLHPRMAGKSSILVRWILRSQPLWLASGSALPADAGVVVAPCGMENRCNLEASWLRDSWGWWRCGCVVVVVDEFQKLQRIPWFFPTSTAGEIRLDPPSPMECSREARVAWGTTWWTSYDQPEIYQFLLQNVSKVSYRSHGSHRRHDLCGELVS